MYLYVAITKKNLDFTRQNGKSRLDAYQALMQACIKTCKIHREKWYGLHIALAMSYQQVQSISQKPIYFAYCSICLQDDCTLLLPCLIDRCKIHRKKWYGFDIALDGFKMGSRWVQHRLWKKVSRWPQDSSGVRIGPSPRLFKIQEQLFFDFDTFLGLSWAILV